MPRRRRRLSSRIALPVTAAVLLSASLIGTLWWQLQTARPLLTGEATSQPRTTTTVHVPVADEPIDADDEALSALRHGDVLALRGEWADAEAEYRLSVERGGGLPALRKLAQTQLQLGRDQELQNTIDQMHATGAREEDTILIEHILLLRRGDMDAVRERLRIASDSPQKNYVSALLAIVTGDHEAAKTSLDKVQQGGEPVLRSSASILQSAYEEYALFPQSPSIHLQTLLARALAQVQQCPLALPLLSQVTSATLEYRDAWIVQGFCQLTMQRPAEALASFEQAYALDPEKPETQYFLARTYALAGDHPNAVTFLQYAISNGFTPEAEARGALVKEALALNDLPLALEAQDALTNLPDATFEMYRQYVSIALSMKDEDRAIAKAQASTEKWNTDPKTFELLGWTLMQAERDDEARAALEHALQLDPYAESVRQKLDTL